MCVRLIVCTCSILLSTVHTHIMAHIFVVNLDVNSKKRQDELMTLGGVVFGGRIRV